MQINSGNFARLGLTLEAAFDPCRSIAAAAVLASDHAGGQTHEGQQSALRVALSRYNTGNGESGFANGYVHKVELAARHVVPALDVGLAPAATDKAAAMSTAPVDPKAPPSWDVWPSFDYAATHPHEARRRRPMRRRLTPRCWPMRKADHPQRLSSSVLVQKGSK